MFGTAGSTQGNVQCMATNPLGFLTVCLNTAYPLVCPERVTSVPDFNKYVVWVLVDVNSSSQRSPA